MQKIRTFFWIRLVISGKSSYNTEVELWRRREGKEASPAQGAREGGARLARKKKKQEEENNEHTCLR
ncbi:MAG TPA: hypothetical protein PK597_03805, partial [Oscillospiraceae bacterium]|nr:hypothetical protein [Oscillospiraceae bacterium]